MSLTCVNCNLPLVSLRRPFLYCGMSCQQEAGYIRYARAVTRDGRIVQPDVLEALRIRKAWVLGGGYPVKALTLKKEVRTAVFDRDKCRCVVCGDQATQIDHHPTDRRAHINDPINLRALCAECHRKKSLSNLRPIDPETEPDLYAKARELDARVQAETPIRLSDDEKRWKSLYQSIARDRSAFIRKNPQLAVEPRQLSVPKGEMQD